MQCSTQVPQTQGLVAAHTEKVAGGSGRRRCEARPTATATRAISTRRRQSLVRRSWATSSSDEESSLIKQQIAASAACLARATRLYAKNCGRAVARRKLKKPARTLPLSSLHTHPLARFATPPTLVISLLSNQREREARAHTHQHNTTSRAEETARRWRPTSTPATPSMRRTT